MDSEWHNNNQIQNIDYFFDVSCDNHSNNIDCLDYFVITGSLPWQAELKICIEIL
jgi:hypothetical protein